MSRPILRPLLLAIAATGLSAAVAPRGIPESSALAPVSAQAIAMVTFGLRVLTTLLSGYAALVLTAVAVTSARSVPDSVTRAIQRWTTSGLAGLVRRSIGLSVVVAGALPLSVAGAQAPTGPPPILAPVDQSVSPQVGSRPPSLRPASSPPTAPDPVVPQSPTPPAPPSSASPAPVSPAPTPGARWHRVEPGESFWTIATDEIADRLGRNPSELEIAGYWVDLIGANASLLIDPGDPDLLLPHQVLRLV